MATTKERLTEIGGFEALVDFFSDDYELGNRIAKNERVELISFPVSIVYPQQSVGEAFRHQLRWCLSIRFSRPAGYVGLLFTQGLPLALIAALLSPKLTIAAAFIGTYLVLRYSVAFAIGLDGIRDDLIRRKFYFAAAARCVRICGVVVELLSADNFVAWQTLPCPGGKLVA